MRHGPTTVIVVLAFLAGAGATASSAFDQYPRGPLPPIGKACNIETRPVSFGAYDALSYQPLPAQGSVIYTCYSLIPLFPVKNIRIEISKGGAGSYDRQMSFGAERLFYNLYLDSNYATVWGDGSGGSQYYYDPNPPNLTPVNVPIYGRVLGRQNVTAGNYADTLQVKILF